MKQVKFWDIKPEIRILGIDDGSFKPRSSEMALLVGVVARGGSWIDGVLSTHVAVDGADSTQRVIEMVNQSKHKGQLRVIMTDGATFAGFNVVDIRDVFAQTGIPVITVSRERPNLRKVKWAVKNLLDWHERWRIIKKAGKFYPVRTRAKAAPVYIQIAGIKRADAEQIVKLTATRSFVPEPLRVAHLIARGITYGESEKV
jgi:endonuclease V-like protein UPF0215 family